jgi:hypothetical protein
MTRNHCETIVTLSRLLQADFSIGLCATVSSTCSILTFLCLKGNVNLLGTKDITINIWVVHLFGSCVFHL